MTITYADLPDILASHKKWLYGEAGGNRAILTDPDLRNVILTDADLRNAILRNANLRNADLRNANLSGANLRGANLRNADLRNVILPGAELSGADLSDANLSDANLINAILRNANLSGANLSNATLSGAILTGAVLTGALSDGHKITTPPVDITGLCWPIRIGDTHMRVGCQIHTLDRWNTFSDALISRMDCEALAFWRQWKEPLLAMARAKGWGTSGESKAEVNLSDYSLRGANLV